MESTLLINSRAHLTAGCLLGLLVSNLVLAAPQTGNMADHPVLSITVDGSTHPELIPDQVAYRHFVLSAIQTGRDHRLMLLSRLGLSPTQEAAFLSALDGVQEQLNGISWAETQPLAANASAARISTYHEILDSALSRLKTAISAESFAKLDGYVN